MNDQDELRQAQADLQALHARFQKAHEEWSLARSAFSLKYGEDPPRSPYPADDPRLVELIEARAKALPVEAEYRSAIESFQELKRKLSGVE